MTKYKVWQVGWENEARVLDILGDECPACEFAQRLPANADPIVVAMQRECGVADHRHLTPMFFGLGISCRKATPEEITQAEETARLVKAKKIEPLVETKEEAESARKLREFARGSTDFLVGSILSASKSPVLRAVGGSTLHAWAARQGAELGRRAQEKKQAEQAAEGVEQKPKDT